VGDDKTQVIAAVIKRDDKYLICQRALNDRYGGMWEFPGGKLKANETFLDATKRELKEELGIQVISVGDILFTHEDPGSSYLINFIEVDILGEPTVIEHNAINWITLENALDFNLAINDRIFCEFLLEITGGDNV
jgi:8-oxo-dGTP diphosphatase